MRLRDIMSSDVETIRPEAPAEEAWQRMHEASIRHLVVVDGGEAVGVISDRDLGSARGAAVRRERSVADLMSGRVVTADPDTTLRRAANMMRGRSLGCLPVVEGGRLRGIVTISDLLEQVGRGAERFIEKGNTRVTLAQRGPRGAERVRRHP